MSRISRFLISASFVATAFAGCKSDRDDTTKREEPTAGTTTPAQTTRTPMSGSSAATPSTTTPTTPATPSTTAPSTTTTPSTTTPGATAMNDGQIAAIASTAHQAEIDAGKLAMQTSKNPDVIAFAKMMVTDHTAANDKAKALVARLDLATSDTDATKQMKSDADDMMKRLKPMSGADFDKAYIADQVKMHQQVLDALDTKLIPSATNAELKSLLTEVRPKVADHLEQAKKLEAKLAK
jgi:putative membrane protein